MNNPDSANYSIDMSNKLQIRKSRIFTLFVVALMAAGAMISCQKTATPEKPKYLWMCGEANLNRFATKDSVTYYLEKAKETGFNNVVCDIRPVEGMVLYKSKFAPELICIDSVIVDRDWDYLAYVIEEAHRLGMKVTASACIFPVGSTYWHKGWCFEDSTFDYQTCTEYLPDGSFGDIRDNRDALIAFNNPADPRARQYAMDVVMEVVRNYDIDGFALDYCRYPGDHSDFSPETRALFEDYIGEKVENWPADVFTYNEDGGHNPGKYYKQWWAFRAGIISDFIHEIQDSVKAEKPNVDINYWAASWIHAIHKNGQNWASPRSSWCMNYDYGTEEYQRTGFAPYVDNFIVGAYLERVYGPDDNESVEYALNRADTLIKGDCHVIGSIQSINHSADAADPHNLTNAVRCCLEKSEGLMVFDIVHIIRHDQWAQIKEGIDQYEATQK